MQLGNEHILCPLVLIIIYATSLPQYFGCLDIFLFFFFFVFVSNEKIARLVSYKRSSNPRNQIYHPHTFPGMEQ